MNGTEVDYSQSNACIYTFFLETSRERSICETKYGFPLGAHLHSTIQEAY